jgi:HPt (histidine-containing phosphotransfer) domain-containing protein
MSGDRQKCLDAGCDDFATKPFDRVRVIEQIRALVSSQQEQSKEPTSPSPAENTFADDSQPMDMSLALRRVGGDHSLLVRVGDMIAELAPQWLKDLQQALDERDTTTARRMAHTLKNSAENVGGLSASAILFRLETLAARGDLDSAIALFPEAEHRMLNLIDALRQLAVDDSSPALATVGG